MKGDESEAEVLFSNLRWSSGIGGPSLPAHRVTPVSLAPQLLFMGHFWVF